MTVPCPNLQTSRLILRPVQADDATALCAYRALPEVARFQSWSRFDMADAHRLVAAQAGLAPGTPGRWFQLVMVARDAGAVVGDLAIRVQADDPRQAEIGVNLAPSWQRRGVAAEAVGGILAWMFQTCGMHRVFAVTDADNVPASGLLRRLGFRQEARFVEHVWFKGGYGSEDVFAMLAREWRGLNPSAPAPP